jgi:tetratricopeptide (TPR) repeat protein
MPRFLWSCLSLAWVLLGSAAPLAAQASPESARDAHAAEDSADVDKARQLFTEGLSFVEAGDWTQAEDRFRRVLALKSSHVVSYNLASALHHLGRVTEASELLRVILRDPSADAATHDAAQQLLTEIEPLIGSITIRVSGDTSGARLSLDDRPLELSALVQTLSVDPGHHHVVIARADAPDVDRDVTVGGDFPLQADVAIELPARVTPEAVAAQAAAQKEAAAPAAATSQARGEASAERDSGSVLTQWWLWAGVGAVAVAGVITAVLVASSAEQAKPIAGDPVIRGRVVQMEMP